MGEPLLLKGAPVARRIREEVAKDVTALKARQVHPHLAFVFPSADGGARSYAESQRKSCEAVGIAHSVHPLPEPPATESLVALLKALQADPGVTGILLHSPLPPPIDEFAARGAIKDDWDAEGLGATPVGRWYLGAPGAVPATPAAVLELLSASGIPLAGKDLVIVGRSAAVGRTLAVLALRDRKGPTVTICHSATPDLGAHTRRADVVVVAAGRPGLLRGDMVREGAVVVDVGTNMVRGADGTESLVGDVDFASVAPRCAAISPVPGGVGPITSALLLRNVVACAALQFPE